jgi:hypothetical protein
MVQNHGSDAADAVAQYAEEDSAGSPAEHEDGGRVGSHGVGGLRAHEVAEGGLARQVEKLLRHGVEHPAERSRPPARTTGSG